MILFFLLFMTTIGIILILPNIIMAEYRMSFPGEKWEETKPESQGVNSYKLQTALNYLEENSGDDGISEVVIIRNGYMIWKGTNIDKIHGVWSVTKSFTSTVLGLLIDDGEISIDTYACDFVPDLKKTYSEVKLIHFTTMTSGYRAAGDEPKGSYVHGPSSTPFIPSEEPLFVPPGSKYAYWDSAMNQFGNVLSQVKKEPIAEIFKKRIAEPIGMNNEAWNWGNFGIVNGVLVNGGSGNNNKQIRISAREIARFGHLFLNRGNWNGTQLISSSWVNKATSVQVPAFLPLEKLSGADGRGVYGFNWWVNGIKPDGKRLWEHATEHTYAAMGYNNNAMFIIPEWNMVIVRLGLDQNSNGQITNDVYSVFLGKIGEAIYEY